MRYILCIILSLFTLPSFALLPPYYQGAKEITAILNDADVANKITSGRVIENIARTENGYRITANECTLDITVKTLPPKNGMVGPAEFEIVADTLVCEKDNLGKSQEK